MNARSEKTMKALIQAMKATGKGTRAYDTTAQVVRVDGDTCWVHIPGGVAETPVKLTINATKGDLVQVRVSGGKAWIVGNETKPPTDDAKANVAVKQANKAQKTADDASKVATNYMDFNEYDGLTVGHKDLKSKVNISGDGLKLYDETGKVGTEIKSGEITVGTDETNKIELGESGISLESKSGIETFVAGVSPTAETIIIGEATTETEFTISRQPISGSRIYVYMYSGSPYVFQFTEGVPATDLSWKYDGERTFTFIGSIHFEMVEIRYTVTDYPPYLTFGTRDPRYNQGGYSSTFGQGLIATKQQVVIGNYNMEDRDGNYQFIVGNGTRPSSRSNGLALGNDGSLHLLGDLYVGCYGNSTGGEKVLTQAQGGTLTITVPSNSYADSDLITFDRPYDTDPLVVAGLGGTITAYGMGSCSCAAHSVTGTGFKIRAYNNSANDKNITVRWIAIRP